MEIQCFMPRNNRFSHTIQHGNNSTFRVNLTTSSDTTSVFTPELTYDSIHDVRETYSVLERRPSTLPAAPSVYDTYTGRSTISRRFKFVICDDSFGRFRAAISEPLPARNFSAFVFLLLRSCVVYTYRAYVRTTSNMYVHVLCTHETSEMKRTANEHRDTSYNFSAVCADKPRAVLNHRRFLSASKGQKNNIFTRRVHAVVHYL